jgi:hypothetical protein
VTDGSTYAQNAPDREIRPEFLRPFVMLRDSSPSEAMQRNVRAERRKHCSVKFHAAPGDDKRGRLPAFVHAGPNLADQIVQPRLRARNRTG